MLYLLQISTTRTRKSGFDSTSSIMVFARLHPDWLRPLSFQPIHNGVSLCQTCACHWSLVSSANHESESRCPCYSMQSTQEVWGRAAILTRSCMVMMRSALKFTEATALAIRKNTTTTTSYTYYIVGFKIICWVSYLFISRTKTYLIRYSMFVSLAIFLFILDVNMVKIAVIGCGLMGIKIAGVCALNCKLFWITLTLNNGLFRWITYDDILFLVVLIHLINHRYSSNLSNVFGTEILSWYCIIEVLFTFRWIHEIHQNHQCLTVTDTDGMMTKQIY